VKQFSFDKGTDLKQDDVILGHVRIWEGAGVKRSAWSRLWQEVNENLIEDKKVEYRNRIDRRVLPWGKAEQWGSLCATVFCELCTSTEARALSYSSVYFLVALMATIYYFLSWI